MPHSSHHKIYVTDSRQQLPPPPELQLKHFGRPQFSLAHGFDLLNFCSKVIPLFSTILNLIFRPWLFWASFNLVLLASSPPGVWGTNKGTSKPPFLNQFFFLEYFFFCLWSSS